MKQSKELLVAVEAAKAAGKVLMHYYGRQLNIQEKSARLGIVTDADIAAQKKIESVISKKFPKAFFYAEEDQKHEMAEEMWIIDPLDGTSNFAFGIRFFGVSIAYWKKGQILSGVIFDPVKKELFFAEKGKGAFLNGKRLRASKTDLLKKSVLNIGLPTRSIVLEKNHALLEKFIGKIGGHRLFGSATLQFGMLAMGHLDAYVEYGLYPWDMAAGILLVEEAGGKVTNENGERFDIFRDEIMVASNGKIHGEILSVLGDSE